MNNLNLIGLIENFESKQSHDEKIWPKIHFFWKRSLFQVGDVSLSIQSNFKNSIFTRVYLDITDVIGKMLRYLFQFLMSSKRFIQARPRNSIEIFWKRWIFKNVLILK